MEIWRKRVVEALYVCYGNARCVYAAQRDESKTGVVLD